MFGFPFTRELSDTVEISTRNNSTESNVGYNMWKSNNETFCFLSAGCQGCSLGTSDLFEVIAPSVRVLVEIWRNPSSCGSLFWIRMG